MTSLDYSETLGRWNITTGSGGASNLAALFSHAPQLSIIMPSCDWGASKMALCNTSQEKMLDLILSTKAAFLRVISQAERYGPVHNSTVYDGHLQDTGDLNKVRFKPP